MEEELEGASEDLPLHKNLLKRRLSLTHEDLRAMNIKSPERSSLKRKKGSLSPETSKSRTNQNLSPSKFNTMTPMQDASQIQLQPTEDRGTNKMASSKNDKTPMPFQFKIDDISPTPGPTSKVYQEQFDEHIEERSEAADLSDSDPEKKEDRCTPVVLSERKEDMTKKANDEVQQRFISQIELLTEKI